MRQRVFRALTARALPAACGLLLVASCGHSPTAPMTTGLVVVYVSENGTVPAPGKKIEIVGTSQTQLTDKDGLAYFAVPAGSQVVRAYDIGTPGPPPPYVEKSVEVQSSHSNRVEFYDCTLCR